VEDNDRERLNETMLRLKSNIQEMHLKILSQNQHINKHREKGIKYLEDGEEPLAESEARLLLYSVEQKQVYIDVKEKMILLHKELGKPSSHRTPRACARGVRWGRKRSILNV
jgi:hypothetical protein